MTRYVVGTRDTGGKYQAVIVEAATRSQAQEVAVRKMEDNGVYARAVSTKEIHPLAADHRHDSTVTSR